MKRLLFGLAVAVALAVVAPLASATAKRNSEGG
jgi:hypothetical protein